MNIFAAGFRSFLRLLANHCIIPPLRIWLFRLSGVRIGKRAFINMDVKFIDDWIKDMIAIEDEVSVASFACFIATSNPNNSFLAREFNVGRTKPVRIKKGAWIGAGAVILPGVTVGSGAIVGANSVVTKDIDNLTVVAGNPAQIVGSVPDRYGR